MAELPGLSVDDFVEFCVAVHGYPPFPWQKRLAERVASGEGWPKVLDLPTGCGKTSAIDIALFHLAIDAGKANRNAPLRIVYIVDRRTIVDQAHTHAQRLQAALVAPNHPVLVAVRARLASIGRDAVPLLTTLLRGGIARNDQWARSPDQPLIAVSTVDQVGSRLLFRGYGVSDSMKPVHAGLLGNDVLFLLDEVHLSQPLRETLAAVEGRYGTWAERPLAAPFGVVEMSATHATADSISFELGEDDQAHPLLDARLGASKPTRLATCSKRDFAKLVTTYARAFVAAPGATVAVVVNRVESARAIHRRLREEVKDADIELVTGRMRPYERSRLERRLTPRIRAGRDRDPSEPPMIVVATQCIEAGADFDFDALVSECASLDALRQRFGRLNRLGAMSGPAPAVIVAQRESLAEDPVYGDALGTTWRWLETIAAAPAAATNDEAGTTERVVDFGIRALPVPENAEELGLLAPRPHAPILLPTHLDSWVQTAPVPTPDPDVALWLHGPERGAADVQVVWRADLVPDDLVRAASAADDDAANARDVILGLIEALPPASGEAMPVPFAAVRRWLEGSKASDVVDVEGALKDASDSNGEPSKHAKYAVVWRGEASTVIDASGLRPGDTIVVPASCGGALDGTWAPESTEPVNDVAEFASFEQRGRPVLRVHSDIVTGLLGSAGGAPPIPGSADEEEVDDQRVVGEWLERIPSDTLPAEIRPWFSALRSAGRRARVERIAYTATRSASEYFLVSGPKPKQAELIGDVSTEDDRASFTGVEVPLPTHLAGVGETAAELARRVGLPDDVVADLRLAGRWHDTGKIDPRFQRLLHGGSEFKALVTPAPLAKSKQIRMDWRARRQARERAGYPEGMRHELLSVALMMSAEAALAEHAHDLDLVLHLVASHHGRCRPFAPWVPDPNPVQVAWTCDGIAVHASSAHHLERLDSGVAVRFWRLVRRYGWWRLAWLEALLRLADHRRSEEEQGGV